MAAMPLSLEDILEFLQENLPFISLEPSFALTKYQTDNAGIGLKTNERIPKNAFVIEYGGEVISFDEAAKREQTYTIINAGCYMFFCQSGRMKVWYVRN
jgi:hypothetical protein